MRKTPLIIAACLAACLANPCAAAPQDNPERPPATQAHASARAAINALMKKNPHGGRRLAAAIARLLTRQPDAIADVVEAVAHANQEQTLALQQGLAQAIASLSASDPGAAKQIQAFLKANSSNPGAAAIAGDRPDTVQTSSGQAGSNSAGAGTSSGLVGGALISPH